MDRKAFAELQDRLLEVNKVITKLDSSIRVAAFDLLRPYISTGKLDAPSDSHKPPAEETPSIDVADLIQKHGEGKPHENVTLLAAIWFSEYGSHPFSLDYIREKATSTGVTVPERPDMTLRAAMENGKKLYEAIGGKGLFRPTVVGEAFLKTTYRVKKGTKAPPAKPK